MELLGEMLKDGFIKPNPVNERRGIIRGMPGFIICIERAVRICLQKPFTVNMLLYKF